jgi:hypothetical protein
VVRARGSGRWGLGMCVPVLKMERLGLGMGLGLGEGETVGEEATADGGAVLGGLAVAVEEVQLLVGFGGWVLRGHCLLCGCSLCLLFLIKPSASLSLPSPLCSSSHPS